MFKDVTRVTRLKASFSSRNTSNSLVTWITRTEPTKTMMTLMNCWSLLSKLYQLNFHVKPAGVSDRKTLSKMAMPRCGVADVVNGTNLMRSHHHHHGSGFHTVAHYSFFRGSPRWPTNFIEAKASTENNQGRSQQQKTRKGLTTHAQNTAKVQPTDKNSMNQNHKKKDSKQRPKTTNPWQQSKHRQQPNTHQKTVTEALTETLSMHFKRAAKKQRQKNTQQKIEIQKPLQARLHFNKTTPLPAPKLLKKPQIPDACLQHTPPLQQRRIFTDFPFWPYPLPLD
ncbi:hypothetical protein QYF36_007822 [Acer negundo]|nr:hypothetical protein QYF36_007822 [Acer negundo]